MCLGRPEESKFHCVLPPEVHWKGVAAPKAAVEIHVLLVSEQKHHGKGELVVEMAQQ